MHQRTNLPLVLLLAVTGAVLTWVASSALNPYWLSVIEFAGINVILTVSLNLTNGMIGLFSLGHPGFMAVGGYTAALLSMPVARKALWVPDLPGWLAVQHWPFLPALLAGGIGAGLTALVIGFPVLRLRGHYLAVATLGFIIIVASLATNLDTYTRGALGLNGLAPLTTLGWVYGSMVITLYVCWKLKHSSQGRTMLALRENEMAARCLGVNATAARLVAFCIGAFFAGLAGGLWVHLVTIITPHSFSIVMAFNLVVMVVIGGAGSISGAALAAVALTMLMEILRPVEESIAVYGITQILVAIGVLAVLIYRPRGLFGSGELRWLLRPAHPQREAVTEPAGTMGDTV